MAKNKTQAEELKISIVKLKDSVRIGKDQTSAINIPRDNVECEVDYSWQIVKALHVPTGKLTIIPLSSIEYIQFYEQSVKINASPDSSDTGDEASDGFNYSN